MLGYAEAYALQQRVVALRKAQKIGDMLLRCEHPHTITLGRSGKIGNLLAGENVLRQKGVEFHHSDRGGDITYHGPGQLVGYPIVNLAAIRRDVGWYVRMLEEAMIRASADFGVVAEREAGKTGIWVAGADGSRPEKLAAIGVHLSRWVTSHGFAYNVSTDLRYFDLIVPCGIAQRKATSLEKLLARGISLREVAERGDRAPRHGARSRDARSIPASEFRKDLNRSRSNQRGPGGMRNHGRGTEPSMKRELTRQQYLDLYYYMRLNRAVEDTMVKLFRQNKIVGGLYSSLGQEGISVGTAYALEKKDWLAPMIRNIGALLVKGVPPRDIFTQHMAKYTSPTLGKDGTSHFGDLENLHIVSPISMLGDLIPVMTGVAMAGRYLGQKIVAMTWIGDGGSSTGVFHEGLNFAAVQKAPFVLILENNQWAYSTPVKRQVPHRKSRRPRQGLRHRQLRRGRQRRGGRVQTAKEAVDRARAGEGPILIEAKSMRMRGHAQHDPAEYVPKEMREYWEAARSHRAIRKIPDGQKVAGCEEQKGTRK